MKVSEILGEMTRSPDVYQRYEAGHTSLLESEYIRNIEQLLRDTQLFYTKKGSTQTEELKALLDSINKQISYLMRIIQKLGSKATTVMKQVIDGSNIHSSVKTAVLNRFRPELLQAQRHIYSH
jgi:hypothetical protein